MTVNSKSINVHTIGKATKEHDEEKMKLCVAVLPTGTDSSLKGRMPGFRKDRWRTVENQIVCVSKFMLFQWFRLCSLYSTIVLVQSSTYGLFVLGVSNFFQYVLIATFSSMH
jgi:hypothetical protein